MKTANDGHFKCSIFLKNLSDFIDNELDEGIRAKFFAHAVNCEACNTRLRELQHIKKLLGKLVRVAVSPECDFRLKSSIRIEYI